MEAPRATGRAQQKYQRIFMRRRILLVCLLLALAGAFVARRFETPRPVPCPVDVRGETFAKLKAGMREREFEAILGAPAGDYRTQKDGGYLFPGPGAMSRDGGGCALYWLTDEEAIQAWLVLL
jgi:hypothetical protein